jgi:tetratricopeptide (TPR) repeat protein
MAKQGETSVQFYQDKLVADSQSLVFSRLADCYRKKGEIQQAIGVCMQGLQLHPGYVTGRIILGRCYLEQEKLKEATMEFVHVIELDRRNHVAVKMLADVYARQGMKEKAGDLYAYLLRMDPDNQSLVKLAQTNRGNGETNVRRILGIAPGTPGSGVSADTVQQEPRASLVLPDTITDIDKTIQMDIVSRQPEGRLSDTAELGEMLVKTQKFDTEELNSAADTDTYRVEETVSDIGAKQGDSDPDAGSITGDDISSRMAMIFGDEQAGEPHLEDMTADATDVVPDGGDANKVQEDTVAAGSIDRKETAATPSISGSDITSRIEQLFGDEQPLDKPGLGEGAASDFTQAYVPGPVVEEEAVNVSDSPIQAPAEPPSSERPLEVHPASASPEGVDAETSNLGADAKKPMEHGDISGKDVTDRLNEMFSDDASASIAEPLAEIGKMLDLQTPAVDDEIQVDLPTESIDMNDKATATKALNESESVAAVSGDDVALRLDTIFEDYEKTVAPSEMEATTVQEDAVARPEEDTRPPVEVSDHAIIINDDNSDSDIHEQGEATLFNTETLIEDENKQGGVVAADTGTTGPALNIDDTVPPEMQPEMSGNDVVGRLDELFSDTLMNGGGLDSIPDGDKDDGEVNQGFYTMSGENAQTAAPEDGMLSELDKSYSDESEKETLDITREAGDKTVLMEQDDRDITLAVADDETILSDHREPLPHGPGRDDASAADSHDVLVNEATQIRLPTADDRTQADADAQYSIPDHVLTPTLADIYYQQGQPKLALQIYNRLLEADPDNERISQRIREIERFIAVQETEETAMVDSKRKKTASSRSEADEDGAISRKKSVGSAKPLAGVRIKKVFKNRIRKSR